MPRKLPNIIDGFLEYTDALPTPRIYRLWSGILLVSSALSRRTWLQANSRLTPCYPNIYAMLVGDPGIGKDVAINKVSDIIYSAIEIAAPKTIVRLGGESISPKGLLDKLADPASKQHVAFTEKGRKREAEFQSLTFCIGELGTAMPEYDPKLVPILNDLYNNKKVFEEKIRGMEVKIPNPHLTMLLGNQPNTLAEVLPDKAFRMGLTSRIIFIFAQNPVTCDLFIDDESLWDVTLEEQIAHDFVDIAANFSGPFRVAPEVKRAINTFNHERPNPVIGNRFEGYNTRRPLHAQKVAMCLAAAESNKQVLEMSHWERALSILSEAEALMPLIFEDVITSRGFSETYDDLCTFVQPGDTVALHDLHRRLSRTHPAYEVKNIIDMAVNDGTLIPVMDETGEAVVKPLRFTVRKR